MLSYKRKFLEPSAFLRRLQSIVRGKTAMSDKKKEISVLLDEADKKVLETSSAAYHSLVAMVDSVKSAREWLSSTEEVSADLRELTKAAAAVTILAQEAKNHHDAAQRAFQKYYGGSFNLGHATHLADEKVEPLWLMAEAVNRVALAISAALRITDPAASGEPWPE